jgi:hypothetical protein
MTSPLLDGLIEPTDRVPVDYITAVIYGSFGLGKSSLLFSASDVYVLDFNVGAHRTEHRTGTVKRIKSWSEVSKISLRDWREVRARGFRTIGIDTCDDMLNYLTAYIVAEKAGHGNPSGGLSPQGWGRLKKLFGDWTKQIRLAQLDLVFVAHEREEKKGDDRYYRPKITGGSYNEVAERADVIARLSRVLKPGEERRDPEEAAGDDPMTYQRQLDFEPCDDWVAKGPEGYGPIIVPQLGERPKFLAQLIRELKDRLGQVSARGIEIAAEVESWRHWITELAEPADFNKMRDQIKDAEATLERPVLVQIRHLLWDHAQSNGIGYDKDAGEFIVAPPPDDDGGPDGEAVEDATNEGAKEEEFIPDPVIAAVEAHPSGDDDLTDAEVEALARIARGRISDYRPNGIRKTIRTIAAEVRLLKLVKSGDPLRAEEARAIIAALADSMEEEAEDGVEHVREPESVDQPAKRPPDPPTIEEGTEVEFVLKGETFVGRVTGVDNLGDKPSVLILPKGKSRSVRVPLDLGTIVPLPADEPSEEQAVETDPATGQTTIL